MDNIAQISAYTDISRFSALRADAKQDGNAAFATVAKEFEALFIQQMLKAARDAAPEGGLFNSRDLKLYREMLDSQVALSMAEQGGLGFATALGQQLGLEATDGASAELKIPDPVHLPAVASPGPAKDHRSQVTLSNDAPAGQSAAATLEFTAALRPLARDAGVALGLAPDILIAQAALETGWGRHVIADPSGRSSHNLFAIKAGSDWNGASVDVQTLEYINDRPVTINARFRAYPNMEAAFADYVAFLREQPRYADALKHDGSARKFVTELAQAGYATDPRYAEKILAIKDQIAAQSTLAQF